jgi:ribonuclease HII
LIAVAAEACRLRLLRGFEDALFGSGFPLVAGVDEAGRGCLAGPVVAAAVIPDPDRLIPGVDDSKRLTPEERERLEPLVRTTARAFAVAAIGAAEIDRINILEATRLAMATAVRSLGLPPSLVLVDAVPLRGLPAPVLPIVRGDQASYAIACASILAKVERDRLMRALGELHPEYGFAQHKGYSAPEHLEALQRYGPCSEHRLTFASVVPRLGEVAEWR